MKPRFGRFLRTFATDLQRAFGGWRFATAVGLIFCIVAASLYRFVGGGSVVSLLGMRDGNGDTLFVYCIVPTLPYATVYATEARERYVRYACLRGGTLRYSLSRMAAATLSGMLACVGGLLLVILAFALRLPLYQELDTINPSPYFRFLLAGRPWAYFGCYLLHHGCTAALFAGLAFLLTALIPNVYVGTVGPAVLYMVYLRLCNYIAVPKPVDALYLVQTVYDAGSSGLTIAIKAGCTAALLALFCGASCIFMKRRLLRE